MSTAAFVHSHDDWWDQLDGKPSSLPASRVGLGFYAKRLREGGHIGVAIWLGQDGRPCVMVGKNSSFSLATDAAEEDFSFNTMAWCMAVTEEAYRAWFSSGAWPDGTVLERPKPKREVKAKVAASPSVASEPVEPTQPAGGVIVRAYQACEQDDPALAFLARVIAPTRGRKEGFSVFFTGASRDEVTSKAHAWIAEERAKALRDEEQKAARKATRRAPVSTTETAA